MRVDAAELIEALVAELSRPGAAPPEPSAPGAGGPVPVGVSARHVHLSAADFAALFGSGASLQPASPLSQPGQFAAVQRVTLVGPSLRAIEGVRVLGPLRERSQVEVSATEARTLGLEPPLRDSGDVAGSAPVVLVGPAGTLRLAEGCILARRHLHLSPGDSRRLGLADGEVVRVRAEGPRGGVIGGVACRVSPSFVLELHLDTDESNALGLAQGASVTIERGEATR